MQNVTKITEKQKQSAKKIIKFILTKTPYICFDSGMCIAFGRYTKMIEQYFEGFKNLRFLETPIKRISTGSNGFVHKLIHKKNEYVAKSILKSSLTEKSDNLFYEYLVGQYINKQCKKFPCFVQTYAWFEYKLQENWKYISEKENITVDKYILTDALILKSDIITIDFFDFACTFSKYLAILIQHVKSAMVFEKMISEKLNLNNFLENELINVLYQVYMPLATLANTFTHYDLHTSNILLCEPVIGKYIKYKYILNDGTIVDFKSKYIVKMIDYGRSFFNDQTNLDITGSSKNIYKTISGIENCNDKYGIKDNTGFQNMEPDLGEFYYISSSTRNISHDLRLLFELKLKLLRNIGLETLKKINPELIEIFNIIEYGRKGIFKNSNKDNPLFGDALYGTKEIYDTSTLHNGMPKQIRNVIDAHKALKTIVLKKKSINNTYYKSMESVGTFLIYESGESMKFFG